MEKDLVGLLLFSATAFRFKAESSSLNLTSEKFEKSLFTCASPFLFLKIFVLEEAIQNCEK